MADLRDYKTETGDVLPGITTPDGQVRLLGYVPSTRGMYAAGPLANVYSPIPRSSWEEVSRRRKAVPIRNQGALGSCNPHGATTALMLARDAAGATFELLSPCFTYALINDGRDAGSNPSDAIDSLQKTGVCLESEFSEGHYIASQIPASAYETAKRFRVLQGEFYSFSTFDELVTAVLLGWPAFYTILIGNSIQLDKNGCLPAYRGVGNHVVSGAEELKKLPSGEFVVTTRNSWDETWGDGGWFGFREAHMTSQPYFQGYAIKAAVRDPLDPNSAVPLIA